MPDDPVARAFAAYMAARETVKQALRDLCAKQEAWDAACRHARRVQDPADRTAASIPPLRTTGGDGKGRIPSHSSCDHSLRRAIEQAEAKAARPAWRVLHGGGMLIQPPPLPGADVRDHPLAGGV